MCLWASLCRFARCSSDSITSHAGVRASLACQQEAGSLNHTPVCHNARLIEQFAIHCGRRARAGPEMCTLVSPSLKPNCAHFQKQLALLGPRSFLHNSCCACISTTAASRQSELFHNLEPTAPKPTAGSLSHTTKRPRKGQIQVPPPIHPASGDDASRERSRRR